MNKSEKKLGYNDKFKILKKLPLVVVVLIVLCSTIIVLKYKDMITIDKLIGYVPDNLFLAALVLLGLFGLKSLSVVFPLSILYLASGFLFPKHVAILVSTIGLIVTITIPYLIGLFCGDDLIRSIKNKYPRTKQLEEYQNNNQFFLCFITRIVGVLPADILSLYFGACKVPYSIYATGGIIGSLLSIVTTTILGNTLNNPLSKEFLLVLLCRISVTVGSIIVHRKVMPDKKIEK